MDKRQEMVEGCGGGGRAAVMGLFAVGGDYKKHQEIHTLDTLFFLTQ